MVGETGYASDTKKLGPKGTAVILTPPPALLARSTVFLLLVSPKELVQKVSHRSRTSSGSSSTGNTKKPSLILWTMEHHLIFYYSLLLYQKYCKEHRHPPKPIRTTPCSKQIQTKQVSSSSHLLQGALILFGEKTT